MTSLENILAVLDLTEKYRADVDRLVSGGPADYYAKKLRGYVQGLFDRAPFKVGSRVRLKAQPTSGWEGHRHFMTPDNLATVAIVDFRGDQFIADVCFDQETWIWVNEREQPVIERHLFSFWESELEVVEREPQTKMNAEETDG